jgi:hypothetical protein
MIAHEWSALWCPGEPGKAFRVGGWQALIQETSMTSAPRGKHKATDKDRKEEHEDMDHELDEALEESFPGSDPVSISQPTGKKPE